MENGLNRENGEIEIDLGELFLALVGKLPLMAAAGLFVAMGNAREDFKKTADMVADTNEHDGVAKILNKF